jgi:hypothetical protein
MSEPLKRPDLDEVTVDTLIALANRGLVKRAQRELDSATPPTIGQSPDGTLTADFADGAHVALTAQASPRQATCSCGAPALCRHRIALVLGYLNHAGQAPGADEWSPGSISDDELDEHFGAAAVRTARRRMQSSIAATVRRASPPAAELSTSTVLFRVPRRLEYATCASSGTERAIAIIQAVWAFRMADERDPGAAEITLDIGGSSDTGATVLADALGRDILQVGIANTSEVLLSRITDTARRLDRLNARWLADATIDLGHQLEAYRQRSAVFDGRRAAELIAELRARGLASGGPRLTPSQIVGADEAHSTPMKLTTLTALGATVRRRGPSVTAVVYVVGDGICMTIHRDWADKPDLAFGGAAVASARMAGTTVGRLAAGSIVTATAERLANRRLKLLSSASAKTSVTPLGRVWENVPPAIRVEDFAALDVEQQRALPRLVRPRHEATDVRILVVDRVNHLSYEPGSQRLIAEIADAQGFSALVVDEYRGETPGALDALSHALSMVSDTQRPAMISGVVRRSLGRLVVHPIAVLLDDQLVIPSFAEAPADELPAGHNDEPLSDAGRTTRDVLDYLAHCAHGGLHQLPRDFAERIREHAGRLRDLGFATTAAALNSCGEAATRGEPVVDAWNSAMIRLATVSERL